MSDYLDDEGYPTDEALERIASWPIRKSQDCVEALRFVASLWKWHDWRWLDIKGGEDENGIAYSARAYFATGGWSGNESLIQAIQKNTMLHMLCWYSSTRGGAHMFKVPVLKDKN